ncbi:lipopolysaccharide assembly protein LapA domain-containing protein [Aerolutibacter ruishenii]|uniref:Uncharacterized protein DUF1049 n=1 Tax=Aerolutibacter ruishenii TaxID=686800 RepID=A0A562LVD2_9GAMM|nr:lipopolysaccharide assembly protein LapA domain-containing protein [Lysobacter ruishenii]TWI11594.1 uncharacterized protein DUF1049 [Lysobacter ruishenii]
MRLIRILVAVACVLVGATLGALNRQAALVDVGFAAVPTTLGVALIVSLLLGVLVGGLAVTFGVVMPLRRRLSRAARAAPATPPSPEA